MILILYNKDDISTQDFIAYCKSMNNEHVALKIEDLVKEELSIVDTKDQCIWKINDIVLDFNQISGVYLRDINFYDDFFKDYIKADRNYVKREWWSYIVYAMSKLHNCINPVDNNFISHRIMELPFFLNCGRDAGFNVPEYFFSNSFQEIEELFYKDDKKHIVMYSLIPSTDFRASNTLSDNAIGLVDYIKGKPIFVHIVENDIFACRYNKSEKDLVDLDEVIKARCIKLCQKLGLKVAQLILIESESGDIYFTNLSIYPNWNLNSQENTNKIFDALLRSLGALGKKSH
jgi:hypothetical protein